MKRNHRSIRISERLYQAAFAQCLHDAKDPTMTDEIDAMKKIEEWAVLGQSRSKEWPF